MSVFNSTVTVNTTGVTVNPADSPEVIGTLNTEVVFAGAAGDPLNFTTYLVTFVQGDETFAPTVTLPATFSDTSQPVVVTPATATVTGGAFVLTCVDQNSGTDPVSHSFNIPDAGGNGVFPDPTMIFNPPRLE